MRFFEDRTEINELFLIVNCEGQWVDNLILVAFFANQSNSDFSAVTEFDHSCTVSEDLNENIFIRSVFENIFVLFSIAEKILKRKASVFELNFLLSVR